MTVMVVDENQYVTQKIASILTGKQIAVTVVLKQTIESAIEYTMYHAVDKIFVRRCLVGSGKEDF